jgi:hypothetical protein
MLPNGVSEVTVASRDAGWFATNRTYPVVVSIDAQQDTATIGDVVFRLYKAENNGYHVSRREGGRTSVLGTVDVLGLRRSTSNASRRDLQAIRAAIYNVDYPAPIAYAIKNGTRKTFAHPQCIPQYRKTANDRVTALTQLKCAKRCVVCKDGIE